MVRSIHGIENLIIHYQNPMGSIYEYDSLLGWKKKADYKGKVFKEEYSSYYNTNSKGLRGAEHSYKKDSNTYRILILGDSFTDGYTVNFNDLFSEILLEKLNKTANKNNNFEVINTGVSGYSTDQEMLYFETEGFKYEPDLTVLMYYDTDHHQNMMPFASERKPYIVLENDSLIVKGIPVPKEKESTNKNDNWGYNDEIKLYGDQPSLMLKIKIWMLFNSELYKLTAQFFRNNKTINSLAINCGLMKESIKPDKSSHKEIPYYNISLDPIKDYAWRLEEKILVQLKNDAQKGNHDFLLFYIPHRMEVYDEEWAFFKKDYELNEQYDVCHIGRCLEKISRKNNIDFIYPLDELKKQAKNLATTNGRLYYKNDIHWNKNGHHLVGEIIAEYISKHYNLIDAYFPIPTKLEN